MKQIEIVDDIVKIEELSRRICWIIKMKGRDILSDFNITPPQFDAMNQLNHWGDMTTGELSQRMYLACSTVTDLLDRMEKNGYVERYKDENDRRIVRVKLLRKGKNVIDKVLYNRQLFLSETLKAYDEKTIKNIYECFEILDKSMTLE